MVSTERRKKSAKAGKEKAVAKGKAKTAKSKAGGKSVEEKKRKTAAAEERKKIKEEEARKEEISEQEVAVPEKEAVAEKTEAEVKEPEKKEKKKKEHKEKPIEKIKFHDVKRELSPEEKRLFRILTLKKKKKPSFLRPEMYKVKKLAAVWRRPRGIDSKQIEGKRGKGKLPGIGYGKPGALSGVDPSGYKPIIIRNKNEISKVNPKLEAAVLSSTIGRRKRNEIIKAANEKGVVILNPRKGEV